MQTQSNVSVNLEFGHSARLKRDGTPEGASRDWVVFVRGRDAADIQRFVEKVVFRLHESFPNPRRVCKEPPYQVEESGSGGFLLPIEVHFKNKELPKKVCFKHHVFLNQEAQAPVNHCEKITFKNPNKDLRKLIKAGGVLVVPGGDEGDCGEGPGESKTPEEGTSPDG